MLGKRKAPGVDNRTMESYTQDEIAVMIRELSVQIQNGTYKPQPVRRVFIDKENGKKRALGIPTVKDRVVQMGVKRILEAIYEQDFLDVSFGYRPGKDPKACIKKIDHEIMFKKVSFVIEADIKGFFDNINHGQLMKCLNVRIRDPRLKRLIWKMLKAGVLIEGEWEDTEKGTPQGGIISPVLANVYLHYCLDLWFEKRVKPRMRGYVELIRYADDFIIVAQYKGDAWVIRRMLTERLKQFSLELSEEKTKVLDFGRFAEQDSKKRNGKRPKTFDFLGFTHYCGKTRDGRFQVRVKTNKKRQKRAIRTMNDAIRNSRSKPIRQVWEIVALKLRGHYNYYGVSGNYIPIKMYYLKTTRLFYKWMNRRSEKRSFDWETFRIYLKRFPLPRPKITYAIYATR